jgi:2'-5' RNA ligase
MHLLHLTLADFFQCPEGLVDTIDRGLADIAGRVRRSNPQFALQRGGVATFPGVSGNIFLDFATNAKTEPLYELHGAITGLLQGTNGVTPELRFTGENYWPHVTLMQQAALPASVFASAVEFAGAVVQDLQVPEQARAWQLILVRFESNAAGDDWDNGRWAADLSWRIVASYPL